LSYIEVHSGECSGKQAHKPTEVGVIMENLRKTCVLDWKCNKRSYVLDKISTCPKPKYLKKFEELRLSQFLHLNESTNITYRNMNSNWLIYKLLVVFIPLQ